MSRTIRWQCARGHVLEVRDTPLAQAIIEDASVQFREYGCTHREDGATINCGAKVTRSLIGEPDHG